MKTTTQLLIATITVMVWATPGLAQETGTPAEGFNVHVTAPHIADGHLIDPMHHYCKVISDAPVLQCLMFESTDPNARLLGIEYLIAKDITREEVSLADWNRNWHDHQVEIDSGVLQIHEMSKEDAQKVTDLVATTDGIVFMTWWPHGAEHVPGSKPFIAQAIGHNIITPKEFKQPLRKPANK